MAYTTATALSLNDVYDALTAFMVTQGWTLVDGAVSTAVNGNTRDKVYFSNGISGKLNMYYRLTSNVSGTTAIREPGDAHLKFPYIFIRGYHNWNATTHSGTGLFGQLGPLPVAGQQAVNASAFNVYPFERSFADASSSLAIPLAPTQYRLSGISVTGPVHQFDGRRKLWAGTTAGVGYGDFATGESRSYSNGLAGAGTNGSVLYKDVNADKEYVYVCGQTGDFYRFDIDANTWSNLPATPWATATTNGAKMVWDGNDYIYLAQGNNTTAWARFSISGNVWTSMAVLPTTLAQHTGASSFNCSRFVYIPASVTGFSEDVIYAIIADSGTTIYRYDVTSNAWRTTVPAGALTCPFTLAPHAGITWDKNNFLILWNPNTNVMYRSVLNVAPNNFTSCGTLDNSIRAADAVGFMNQITTKLRCSNYIPGRYFFHGDKDSIRVVYRIGTNPGSGRYYWTYMGKYETLYQNDTMNLTAGVSPGVRVPVTVDTTSSFVEGQPITFANWSGSHFEPSTLFQFSGSNTFLCNLTSSFPSGTAVGVDPAQHCLSGDCGIAILPANYRGYKTDLEPDWYHVRPLLGTTDTSRHAPSVRGPYMPVKLLIQQALRGAQFSSVSNQGYQDRYESLGYLRNVYALPQKVFPAPQNEDILVFGTDQYIYFNVREVFTNNTDNRGIVIGPL